MFPPVGAEEEVDCLVGEIGAARCVGTRQSVDRLVFFDPESVDPGPVGPRDCRLAISLPHCVDLPALSRPSKTMNLPRRGFAAEDMLLRLRELRFRYDLSLRIFSHILQISLISVSSL